MIVIEPMVCGDTYWEVQVPMYSEGEGRELVCALIPARGRCDTEDRARLMAAEAAALARKEVGP